MGQTFIRELLIHTQELPFPDSICFVYLLNLALKDLGCWGKAQWTCIVQVLFVILGLCPLSSGVSGQNSKLVYAEHESWASLPSLSAGEYVHPVIEESEKCEVQDRIQISAPPLTRYDLPSLSLSFPHLQTGGHESIVGKKNGSQMPRTAKADEQEEAHFG